MDKQPASLGRPCIVGFTDTHLREMLKSSIRPEHGPRRNLKTRYESAISSFWKSGLYTSLGNTKRQIMPSDICPKLLIIYNAIEQKKASKEDFVFFNKILNYNVYSSAKANDKRFKKNCGHIYISWNVLKWINSASKKYGEQNG